MITYVMIISLIAVLAFGRMFRAGNMQILETDMSRSWLDLGTDCLDGVRYED